MTTDNTETTGTIERNPFTNPSLNASGMYACAGCGATDLHVLECERNAVTDDDRDPVVVILFDCEHCDEITNWTITNYKSATRVDSETVPNGYLRSVTADRHADELERHHDEIHLLQHVIDEYARRDSDELMDRYFPHRTSDEIGDINRCPIEALTAKDATKLIDEMGKGKRYVCNDCDQIHVAVLVDDIGGAAAESKMGEGPVFYVAGGLDELAPEETP